jgi:hypothetical protein
MNIFLFSWNQDLTLTIDSEAIKMQTIDREFLSKINSDKVFRSIIVIFFLFAKINPSSYISPIALATEDLATPKKSAVLSASRKVPIKLIIAGITGYILREEWI